MLHQAKKALLFVQKIHGREILACLLLLLGLYFFRQQQAELNRTLVSLHKAHPLPLVVAGVVSVFTILLQAAMYRSSFASVGNHLSWPQALELFLKRNLLSVFMPGGGLGALCYVPNTIKKEMDDQTRIHQGSGLFAVTGMLSTILVGLPILLFHTRSEMGKTGLLTALVVLLALAVGGGLLYRLKTSPRWQAALTGTHPQLTVLLHRFFSVPLGYRHLNRTLLASVGVELCGITLLYAAMVSVGSTASLPVAAFAYILSILLMMASPFLKGLGAVELCIVYILTQSSYTPAEALAIALLYRFFEFWVPLLAGVSSFLVKGKNLFLRIFPACSLFFLGVVNILSVLTPPVGQRLKWIHHWVPSEAVRVTNLFVLFIGINAILCAAYLVKGLRSAWWLALVVSLLSFSGHLLKALDYEEAILASVVFAVLLYTRKYYRVKNSAPLVHKGVAITFTTLVAVLLYGCIGFYFLQKKQFGTEFTLSQSLVFALQGFLLLPQDHLEPLTRFGAEFLNSFRILSLGGWLCLLYILIKPHLRLVYPSQPVRDQAARLLQQYSTSSNDYFKLADDKLLFFSSAHEGFIAYRVAHHFAIVLGEPVCDPGDKTIVVKEFEAYCKNFGLKPVFFRVGEQAVNYFRELKKKKILIGQEALLDVVTFSLNGRDKKSLRNALNSLAQKGYVTTVCAAPHSPAFLEEIQKVSAEWLLAYKKKEVGFAQGRFDAGILQHQDLVVTFAPDGRPVAFLNIIPDLAPGECTYDLIRKATDAPSGCMDALIIELINYAKARNMHYLNLGLAPLSGITTPEHTAERLLQYAYTRVKPFRHYQGLRNFKEKYASQWQNKYIVYDHDFDLLPFYVALKKVMRYSRPKTIAV